MTNNNNAIIETVECSRCSELTELHATLSFEDDETYVVLCPVCLEVAKRNGGSRCVRCDEELTEYDN